MTNSIERIGEIERKNVQCVLDNAFQTTKNSVFNNRLEADFAKLFGMNFAIGHSNGTATMHTALAALGVKPGDEVVVPPLTMSSTSLAVLHNGSIPVYADVDHDTFNIDPGAFERVITKKTKAVITVALYGLSPEYDEIKKICESNGISLIEDNAEAFLSKYRGKLVGTFGDFSSFSFQASKHITSGEGGMLLTNSEKLADSARRFSSLGYAGVSAKQGKITRDDIQNPNYCRHVSLGFNYRMSELQAAVALGQLERSTDLVSHRQKVAALFDDALSDSQLLKPQANPVHAINSYWSYSVVLETGNPERDWFKFREIFKNNGGDPFYAAWKLSYTEPLFSNQVQNYEGVWQKFLPGLCPVAEYLQPRMIQLKTNYWNLEEAAKQADILRKSVREFQKIN